VSAEYIVAPQALDDLDEIADWMRRENPGSDRDLRFIEAAYDAFKAIAQRPGIGHRRPDLTGRPVLFRQFMRSFAIIYRIEPQIEIVHVRRWRQDLLRVLKDDNA
jgi:plasmid stabilization system protein ParE